MSESDAEFREEIRAVIRRNDPDPDELRDLAGDLETLADKWEDASEVL